MPPLRQLCLALAASCLLAACGANRAAYRLTPTGLVIPPGVRSENKQAAKLKFPAASTCSQPSGAPLVRQRNGQLQIRIDRAQLAKLPAGGLRAWAQDLEAQGCIPAGTAIALAEAAAGAVPLPLNRSSTLSDSANSNQYANLDPGYALRIVSPIFREGVENPSALGEDVSVEGGGSGGILVTLRASDDLLGYETAWFDVVPQPDGAGIQFSAATRQVEEESEPTSEPQGQFFDFAPDMAYFRIVFPTRNSEQVDHDSYLLAAPTLDELEANTAALRENPTLCDEWARQGRCAATPKLYGLVSFIRVTIDGEPISVAPGTTLGDALRQAGIPQQRREGPLEIQKLHKGQLRPVECPPGDTRILNLKLTGGEVIRTTP